jgi:hypothetical protein
MKRKLWLWGIIGFFVPPFWGIVSFVVFNATGAWTTAYWYVVYATCPFWLIPGLIGEILMPILNALLYAALAYCFLNLMKLRGRRA